MIIFTLFCYKFWTSCGNRKVFPFWLGGTRDTGDWASTLSSNVVKRECSRLQSELQTNSVGFDRILKSFYHPADSANKLSKDCSDQVTGNAAISLANQVYQAPAAGVLPQSGIWPQPKPGPSHLNTVSASHSKLLYSTHKPFTFPNLNLLPPPEDSTTGTHQVPLNVLSHPGLVMSHTADQHVLGSQSGDTLPSFPPRYDQIPDNIIQHSNLNTQNLNYPEVRGENSELTDDVSALDLTSSIEIPDSQVVEQLQTDLGSTSQTPTHESLNSLGANAWHSGLIWDQLGQNGIINPNQDMKSTQVNLFSGAYRS